VGVNVIWEKWEIMESNWGGKGRKRGMCGREEDKWREERRGQTDVNIKQK